MSDLDVPGVIAHKRDGGEHRPGTVRALVEAFLTGNVDDAQMGAWLMAATIRGLSEPETVELTEALVDSGTRVDLGSLSGPTIDKHSTGGIGDTTTLVVAPLVVAAGGQVAKLSGRGLGHTGGTLDKLEAVPGLRVDLGVDELRAQVERVGIAVAAATDDLVPADRRLYALRDVTATVDCLGLIASSVMSKKVAGGARHVVLDVKAGSGALMATAADARALATRCVALGRAHGLETAALVTSMEQPLGPAVGNALEVAAAVDCLHHGRGRLAQLSRELAVRALELTGRPSADSQELIDQVWAQGAALEVFREWIGAQGGSESVAEDPWSVLPVAPVVIDWVPSPGVVAEMDGRAIGRIAGDLGAGRRRAADVVDPAVGLEFHVAIGDEIAPGQPGGRIHARTREDAERAARALDRAVRIGPDPVTAPPLILDRVGQGDVDGP